MEPLRRDTPDDTSRLSEFLADHRRIFVLTGAGVSTESGIPDYRAPDGSWKHRKPIQYRELVSSALVRKRYWARSFVGWHRIARAEPNEAHRALAELERFGRTSCLVTQNVDGLHQKAGSREVIDLHGRLDRVECLDCRWIYRRDDFQEELARRNPEWGGASGRIRPDGDVDLGAVDYEAFDVPPCPHCGGDLKPWVVFFGEQVPKDRVERAFRALDEADAMLVVGSSLMVFSGYRFVRKAAELGLPVAAVNLGRTRADDLLDFKLESSCGAILPPAVETLSEATWPKFSS